MAYNEAKTLLKRSEISLTVLKPNTSTDSSHRSLTNQLAGQDKAESDSQLGHTDIKHQSPELRQRPRHSRSPSAPVPLMVGGHDFKGIVRHMRCNSAVSGSSFSSYDKRSPGNVRRLSLTEEERAKILKNLLVEEERIRMDNEKLLNDDEISVDQLEEEEKESPSPLQKYLSSSPPPPPHRSNSYMSAVMSHRMANDSPQTVQSGSHTDSIYNSEHNYIHSRSMKRPYSAPGSRHSVTSGSSTGRPDIPRGISPGPLSVNRSDPLALSPKTVGQSSAFSLVTNTSASTATRLTGSLGRANRKYRTPIHTAAGKFYPHQNSSSVQVMAPSSVLPYKVVSTEVYPGAPAQIPKYMQNASHTSNPNEQYYKYRTFPGKTNRINFDPSDRASSYSGMAKTGIKHHKSTSSRASSTSSVSSGYTTPKQDQNFIQPVYEEENVARNEEDANYAEEEYHQQPTGER